MTFERELPVCAGPGIGRSLGATGCKLVGGLILFALTLAGCAAQRQSETRPDPQPGNATPPTEKQKSAIESPTSNWTPLFDSKTLKGWDETAFGGRGPIECQSGRLVLTMGDPFTGLNYTNPFPKLNYEIALDAMRVTGSDFFCGLTVPVGDSFCSLIVGGWGGSLVGISSLDGMDASENETTKWMNFQQGRWYHIRLRVTAARIEGWIDSEKLIDVVTTGRRISLRPGEIELSKPIGIASWQTTAALRDIKMRTVTGPADPPKRGAAISN
jgi:hypothetical protein